MKQSIKGKFRPTKRARLPLLILLVNIILVSVLVWQYLSMKTPVADTLPNGDSLIEPQYNMTLIKNHDYTLISPLRLTDVTGESSDFKSLKNTILIYLREKMSSGLLKSASVYLRKLNDGSWMSIDGHTAYKAGSLLKVPFLICYLKKIEDGTLSLKQQYRFDKPAGNIPVQTYSRKAITPGRSYTVEELLKYMIIESDNNATYVLGQNIDVPAFQKVFTDLGLSEPLMKDMNYSLSVSDYSRFFRVLYSATYLKEDYSNYALKLLTQCSFKNGLASPLPANTVIAHKFGEAVDGDDKELSESGIIYQGDNTYLLTVMTKGNDIKELPEVISEVSKLTYTAMQQ